MATASFKRFRSAVNRMIAVTRGMQARGLARRRRAASHQLGQWGKMVATRAQFKQEKEQATGAVSAISAMYRAKRAQQEAKKRREAMGMVNMWAASRVERKKFKRSRAAATKGQSVVRAWQARKEFA